MTIGGSIFLLAAGAILTFGTNIRLAGINLDVVGIVLMLAGALGLVLSLTMLRRPARTVRERPVERERYVERDGY